jgi:hypothetical protein
LPPPILSFSDQEFAALRTAAAKLLPEQRDQFLRDVASELRRCRKFGPSDRTGHTVVQVAKAVQRRLVNGGTKSLHVLLRPVNTHCNQHASRNRRAPRASVCSLVIEINALEIDAFAQISVRQNPDVSMTWNFLF